MANRKKVVVIGAGPGGLSAAMILAHKGYDVDVFEKQSYVGGRTSGFTENGFTFDLGPTFLMMIDVLEELFQLTGRKTADYLDIRPIDPFYRLVFGDGRTFYPTHNPESMRRQLETLFPGSWEGYLRYLSSEKKKLDKLMPCLKVPYGSLLDYLRPRFLSALPYLDAHLSLFDQLGKYFEPKDLRIAFTFQAKYLGMSPWQCPGTFSMISYIEHAGGVHHPIGGLHRISEAMAKVVREEGGRIHLSSGVEEVLVKEGRAVGVRLQDGRTVAADRVVLNADFGHAMNHLFDRKHLKRWSPKKLVEKNFSCSTFMLYLGLDKVYDEIAHHSILFAPDYEKNVREIAETQTLSDEPSVYVQNACVTDPSLAPPGKSTLYVLVPTPNNRSGIPWDEVKASYREKVLDLLESRGGYKDLRKHIVYERMITPKQWESENFVHLGATFNLGHQVSQMLYFRPHNRFEDVKGCFLVGGGTHPGSGLPTIFESGRISASLILEEDFGLSAVGTPEPEHAT